MWSYRRMLKISWTEHETNQNVLHKLHKERELLQIIKKRKLEYFGNVIRGPKYKTLQVIMQGKIEGKRRIGRKNLSWLRNFRAWTGLEPEQLFRIASDREGFKELVETVVQA